MMYAGWVLKVIIKRKRKKKLHFAVEAAFKPHVSTIAQI